MCEWEAGFTSSVLPPHWAVSSIQSIFSSPNWAFISLIIITSSHLQSLARHSSTITQNSSFTLSSLSSAGTYTHTNTHVCICIQCHSCAYPSVISNFLHPLPVYQDTHSISCPLILRHSSTYSQSIILPYPSFLLDTLSTATDKAGIPRHAPLLSLMTLESFWWSISIRFMYGPIDYITHESGMNASLEMF